MRERRHAENIIKSKRDRRQARPQEYECVMPEMNTVRIVSRFEPRVDTCFEVPRVAFFSPATC